MIFFYIKYMICSLIFHIFLFLEAPFKNIWPSKYLGESLHIVATNERREAEKHKSK